MPAGSIVSTGQKILPSQHNPPLQDIATNGLSAVLLKDGRAPMTGNLPMGGNQITGMADGVGPQDAATVGQAAYRVGDWKFSSQEQDEKWLRLDGAIYDAVDYPDLAEILGPAPAGIFWEPLTAPFGSGNVNGMAVDAANDRLGIVSGSTFYYTDDGISFTSVSLPVTASGFGALEFGGGRWVVLGGSGSTAVSTNGGHHGPAILAFRYQAMRDASSTAVRGLPLATSPRSRMTGNCPTLPTARRGLSARPPQAPRHSGQFSMMAHFLWLAEATDFFTHHPMGCRGRNEAPASTSWE